jgi:hypothetical protein
MTTLTKQTPDALAAAARDISRHISGLADELLHLHHSTTGSTEKVVDQVLHKIKDQIALLSAVVDDLSKAEHQA